MSLVNNKMGPCLKVEHLQKLLKVARSSNWQSIGILYPCFIGRIDWVQPRPDCSPWRNRNWPNCPIILFWVVSFSLIMSSCSPSIYSLDWVYLSNFRCTCLWICGLTNLIYTVGSANLLSKCQFKDNNALYTRSLMSRCWNWTPTSYCKGEKYLILYLEWWASVFWLYKMYSYICNVLWNAIIFGIHSGLTTFCCHL